VDAVAAAAVPPVVEVVAMRATPVEEAAEARLSSHPVVAVTAEHSPTPLVGVAAETNNLADTAGAEAVARAMTVTAVTISNRKPGVAPSTGFTLLELLEKKFSKSRPNRRVIHKNREIIQRSITKYKKKKKSPDKYNREF